MTKSIQALVLTTVLLAPSAAMAGEFEITPFLGYQFGGDLETFYQGEYHDVNINSSENFGVVLSLGLSPMTQIELLYSTQDTKADANRFEDSLGLKIDYWQLSMLWNFDPDQDLLPRPHRCPPRGPVLRHLHHQHDIVLRSLLVLRL
jgi:hypothetical protein